jgi:hypothetical protein
MRVATAWGVRYVVTGSVSRVLSSTVIVTRLYDVRDNRVLAAATTSVDETADARQACADLARRLRRTFVREARTEETEPPQEEEDLFDRGRRHAATGLLFTVLEGEEDRESAFRTPGAFLEFGRRTGNAGEVYARISRPRTKGTQGIHPSLYDEYADGYTMRSRMMGASLSLGARLAGVTRYSTFYVGTAATLGRRKMMEPHSLTRRGELTYATEVRDLVGVDVGAGLRIHPGQRGAFTVDYAVTWHGLEIVRGEAGGRRSVYAVLCEHGDPPREHRFSLGLCAFF